ncbi:MAG: beta-Ala-His dipeptidase [Candidatus Thorarchaeota archaeon]
MVLENLEPKLVWEIFEDVFTRTPRASKKEEKIRAKIKEWVAEQSKSMNLDITISEDSTGNLLLKKSATQGMESSPRILLQGHMDMVCETDRPDGFDFDNEPIPVRVQDNGEWVDAEGTTLGGDNGIGLSIALALLFDSDVVHGPLEILATVDEETGLVGAFGLDTESLGIESKLMINIDSEGIGSITIGSAGGGDLLFEKELKRIEPRGPTAFLELAVSGLFGGHSGVDIHLPRANANKLVARILSRIVRETGVMLCDWNGGSKANAITRDSTVRFGVTADRAARVEETLISERDAILNYYKSPEPGAEVLEPKLEIKWNKSESEPRFSVDDSVKIVRTVHALPHGPVRFSPAVDGLVETSNNLAIIKSEGDTVTVLLSARGNIDEELESFRLALSDLGRLGGWEVTMKPPYPGWAPNPNSPFLQFVRKRYESELGKSVTVEAIHAGLECGIVGAKIPGIQMASIGPSLKNPHTPDEKLKIADVGVLYNLLKSILRQLSDLS